MSANILIVENDSLVVSLGLYWRNHNLIDCLSFIEIKFEKSLIGESIREHTMESRLTAMSAIGRNVENDSILRRDLIFIILCIKGSNHSRVNGVVVTNSLEKGLKWRDIWMFTERKWKNLWIILNKFSKLNFIYFYIKIRLLFKFEIIGKDQYLEIFHSFCSSILSENEYKNWDLVKEIEKS
jgi:hypothetical protein